MKKVNLDILLITCVLCLVPILFGLYFYPELPEMVPVHFNISNNPDGFMSREIFVFSLPIIMMVMQVLVCIILDLRSKNTHSNKSLLLYKLMLPAISIVLYVISILYAINFGIDMFKVALTILGVLFIAIGIDLPNNTGTYINFPKINDEQVYKKAKEVFGVIYIIDGLLSLMAAMFNSQCLIAIMLLVLIEAIGLLLFATWYNIKLKRKK